MSKRFNRNLSVLVLAQGFSQTTNTINTATSPLIGYMMTESLSLATLPLGLVYIATTLSAVPASWLMAKYSRRVGFLLGVMLGMAGALLAVLSLMNPEKGFIGYCMASALIGCAQAFALTYRFAAVEVVDQAYKSQAIALVVAGGIIAAVLGPKVSLYTKPIMTTPYLGTMWAMAGIFAFIMLLLLFYQRQRAGQAVEDVIIQTSRSMREICRQTKFLLALVCAMFSFGVMSFVMSATPLAMKQFGYEFANIVNVMQWHFLGMFVPSLFSGFLIKKLGAIRIIVAGALAYTLCVMINLHGITLAHFYASLILLGIGWNFVFVGGTTLLTETHSEKEKAKVQGFNDSMMYATIALVTLSAGPLLRQYGWETVNMLAMPMVITVFVLAFVEARVTRLAKKRL